MMMASTLLEFFKCFPRKTVLSHSSILAVLFVEHNGFLCAVLLIFFLFVYFLVHVQFNKQYGIMVDRKTELKYTRQGKMQKQSNNPILYGNQT